MWFSCEMYCINIDDHPTKVILKDKFCIMRLNLDGITFQYFFQELFLES